MQKLFLILLLFPLLARSQSESHHFVRYDTVYTSPNGTGSWLVTIERDTSRNAPARNWILTIPGQGEMGHPAADTQYTRDWGVIAERNAGWDGGIAIGNGTHYPVLICATYTTNVNPNTVALADLIDYLLSHYVHKSILASGLSEGAFRLTSLLMMERTAGDETYIKDIQCLAALSGFDHTLTSPYTGWDRDTLLYKIWAAKYHGRYFGTEGWNDVTRHTWEGAQAMNDSVPNSGYFSYNTVDGGNHGDWDVIYNPANVDWRTDPSSTKGPYYSASQPKPFGEGGVDVQGPYTYPNSLFTWMFRQGDTSMVEDAGASAGSDSLEFPVTTEYRTAAVYHDTLYSFVNGSSTILPFPLPGGRTVKYCVGGFNTYVAAAGDGTLWINQNDFTTNWTQFATDSGAGPINTAILPDAMANNYLFISSTDSSLWYGGADTLHLLHSTGGGNYNFIKISGSLKIKKARIGLFRILALTTTGQVYEWARNSGSITPTQKTLPGAGYALDIEASHYDYAIAIIPNAGESSGYGWPYVWGTQYGVWGGSSAYTQPTAVKMLWGLTVPIRQVSAAWNTTHVIDSLGHMWGLAYTQTNGELGNGIEYANRYDYSAPYSWTFADGEHPSGAPMVQIGAGITWRKMYACNWFGFYLLATDENDSLYFWGRDKALVSFRGYLNANEENYPNALDVLSPLQVHPLAAVRKTYNFTLPSLSAGTDQTVTAAAGTLTASGHPALLINSSIGTDTLDYRFAAFTWTCMAMPSGAPAPTFGTPTLKTTTVSGLRNGSYTFQVISTDNNSGTSKAVVNWTVNIPATNCLSFPFRVKIN